MYLHAQETFSVKYIKKPLSIVLQDLESKTGVVFSYSVDVVKNFTVSIENPNISFSEVLTKLSEQTKLTFEKINDKQIIVRKLAIKIELCGYLINSIDGDALPFASIFAENSDKGTISDENGFFRMNDIDSDATLRIEYIGFKGLSIKAEDSSAKECITIKMTPEVQPLEEVVVLGYLTTGVNKNSDGSFTMVEEEMGIFPGLVEPDILQSIQFAPGITSLDESASGIQIRGGSPDQNLIFFDGIKMYNTGHFFGMISAFNPYVIESAKIFKGGASPEYGDRVSGVVDIATDENVPKKVSGGLGVNGTHGDLFLKAPLGKKMGLVLSARRSYTDMLQTPTFQALSNKVFQNTRIRTNEQAIIEEVDDDDDEDEITGTENFFFYDANAKIILQPSPNDKLNISGLYTKNNLDFSLDDDEDITSDRFDIENKGASLNWEGTKWKRWHHGMKAYYSSFNSNYENTVTEDNFIEEQSLRSNTVEDFGLDFNLSFELFPLHDIQFGYQFSRTQVFFKLLYDEETGDDDNFQFRDYDITRTNENIAHSIYTEYSFKPKNKGFISLGARASSYSIVNDYFFEPRINAEYLISNVFRLKGTFEKRYQPISQLVEFEDIQIRLENSIWTLSNGTDIPLLESTQYSGGMLVDVDGWILDVDGYIKNISGLTSFTNGFNTSGSNLSIGESDVVGLDVLVKKKIVDFNLWLGYTFNDIEYTFPDLQSSPFRGNNDITHNFRISNTYEKDNWQFSLGWNYRTGSPFTPVDSFDPETNTITYGAINSLRLPDYHRLDASAIYKIGLKSNPWWGELGVSLQNIYARSVPISVFYRVDTNVNSGESDLTQVRQLSLGLTPNVVFRVYF
tara:strand:+ start:272998 stop:275553 length:2556 start_codon:yes stop_codon:yes gene_type:complete